MLVRGLEIVADRARMRGGERPEKTVSTTWQIASIFRSLLFRTIWSGFARKTIGSTRREGGLVQSARSIGRANKRTAHDTKESGFFGFLSQLDEFFWLDPAVDWMVQGGRPKVLSQGEEFATGRA